MTNPAIQPESNPEPYRPSGMPEFKVGDPVRWRISAECGYRCEDCGVDGHVPIPGCEVCKNATQGHIYQIGTDKYRYHTGPCKGTVRNMEHHKYFIWIHDTPECKGFWAAASELELLPVAGAENARRREEGE